MLAFVVVAVVTTLYMQRIHIKKYEQININTSQQNIYMATKKANLKHTLMRSDKIEGVTSLYLGASTRSLS